MSYREVSVIEIREMLRLWLQGLGLREVARLSGTDRKTVRRYVDRAFSSRVYSGRVAIGICLESYDPNIEWNEPGGGNAPGRVAAFRERTPTEVLSGPRLIASERVDRGTMTINTAETVGRTERVPKADRAQFAGLASVGAGAIHLAAA